MGKPISGSAADNSDVSFGLTLMAIAVLIAPLIDIFSKLAIATIPSGQITAIRFTLQVLFILPVVALRGALFDLTWKKTALHALRGVLLVATMLSFITTLKVMEVADAIAIFFVEPIILTILGSIFLKETIGWRRYTACGVGFFGAMLVVQPSMQEVGLIALLPIVSAFTLAVFLLVTRLVAQSEDPWSMQFHAGIWGALFSAALLYFGEGTGSDVFDPVVPDALSLVYVLGVGVAATISGVLGVYAYRAAPASVLAPLQYLEIVSATLFGWLVFNDLPDALKWLGISIIITSGLYIIWREHRLNKTAGTAPVSPAI
ncbi:S-adenosylmethionine uptake transporter [Pararhizobium capsulatum DSM 1112]|uniref:S-adenosylmethionine uptake transporter n=1 Tax=Pararhizobium capsulatum DSM 1112 TaxID=1121113 RepID=A0ABU0BSN3_9HYPH|nr:DMT family transporter [Pararhizobium capsulatum]MDQ0320972.1 S-adenosylmethionine uptake transporter [Pararhizobium capsulatum DSM 1112]